MLIFRRFVAKLPLTVKMTMMTLALSLIVFGGLDFFVNRAFRGLFENHVMGILNQQAQENRLRFDGYIDDFFQLVRLFANNKHLQIYLQKNEWYDKPTGETVIKTRYPSWFPGRSLMRSLAHPRFAILFDQNYFPREIYHRRSDHLPEILRHPDKILTENSQHQTNMTTINGTPYVITAEEITSPNGIIVTILLASPIDDEMFLFIQGDFPKHLVGVVDTETKSILSSSNPSLLPKGLTLETIKKNYLFSKRNYQDYGRVGLLINFYSFVPKRQFELLVNGFVSKERQYRALTAASLLIAFVLLMLVHTAKIERLVKLIRDFSRREAYGLAPAASNADQLIVLQETFKYFMAEIELRTEELGETNEELSVTIESLIATRDELIQAEKLAVVGQMAGVIAHEVLNPITAVSIRINKNLASAKKTIMVLQKQHNLLDTLTVNEEHNDKLALILEINRALGKSQHSRLTDLQFIERLIIKISKIVDGFRQMSRSKRHIESVNIADLIHEIVEDLQDRLQKNSISLDLQLENTADIKADYMELHLVISNLLRNAIQAIEMKERESKNKITISLLTPDNRCLEIIIQDTGIGIAKENFAKIFEPNFTSKGRQGTGIGLSISRKIVRGYNGELSLMASIPGAGSTFHVLLCLQHSDIEKA